MNILIKETKTLYLNQKILKELLKDAGVDKFTLDGAWLEKKSKTLVLHFTEAK